MNIDDINKLLAHIDLKAETKKIENDDDAKLRRFKEKGLFITTLFVFYSVMFICTAFVACHPNSSYVGIALNGIIGLGMALTGYYVRGKTH